MRPARSALIGAEVLGLRRLLLYLWSWRGRLCNTALLKAWQGQSLGTQLISRRILAAVEPVALKATWRLIEDVERERLR